MDTHLDSESYWNRSSSKAFSFDDDDENDDVIKGSGSITVPGAFHSQKWDSISILNDDTISEASFDNSSNFGPALNLSINAVISEEALKCLLEEQTLDEKVIAKGVSPEVELKLLRRQIQTMFYSPSPAVTAQKMLLGKQCPLDVFKSLHEKEQLLDAVIGNGGGDAIIGVLLFLRKTLTTSKFRKILQQRPKALQHYISYLNQRQSAPYLTEACELLVLFGKHHDAALLEFKMLHQRNKNTVSDLVLKQQKLRQLLARYNAGPSVIGISQQIFQNELKLLEFITKERSALDNSVDADSTPIEVLHACCRKHNNWQEQDTLKSTSPFRICAELQISPAQFEWTALNERATQQAYADLECVFERVPTWHPLKQKKFHISFSLQAAILRLYQLEAPSSVLYLFLTKIGNANEKLTLAQRVKCVKASIDALGSLKDVAELTRLKNTLPERSEEQFYCDKILKGLQNKRWTTESIKIKL